MKILIELPTWLGDSIMATPAIENLISHYRGKRVSFSVVGTEVSIEALRENPNIENFFIDDSRNLANRLRGLKALASKIGYHDIAITFRNSFNSAGLFYFIGAKFRVGYKRNLRTILLTHSFKEEKNTHQVLKYNNLINSFLKQNYEAKDLKLYNIKSSFDREILALNPGAKYGSAKRWYPSEFAKVAIELSDRFDILIFGSKSELQMAKDIENELKRAGIVNYQNLAGETTLKELIQMIAGVNLFITNDSGPMHIASAYKIPTVAIFGPTNSKESSPWQNPNAKIVNKSLNCSPCMRRVCPLKTHECMRSIKAKDVLNIVRENF